MFDFTAILLWIHFRDNSISVFGCTEYSLFTIYFHSVYSSIRSKSLKSFVGTSFPPCLEEYGLSKVPLSLCRLFFDPKIWVWDKWCSLNELLSPSQYLSVIHINAKGTSFSNCPVIIWWCSLQRHFLWKFSAMVLVIQSTPLYSFARAKMYWNISSQNYIICTNALEFLIGTLNDAINHII